MPSLRLCVVVLLLLLLIEYVVDMMAVMGLTPFYLHLTSTLGLLSVGVVCSRRGQCGLLSSKHYELIAANSNLFVVCTQRVDLGCGGTLVFWQLPSGRYV